MDRNFMNELIDEIIEQMANDDEISIIEFHIRFNKIETARNDLNDSFNKLLDLLDNEGF